MLRLRLWPAVLRVHVPGARRRVAAAGDDSAHAAAARPRVRAALLVLRPARARAQLLGERRRDATEPLLYRRAGVHRRGACGDDGHPWARARARRGGGTARGPAFDPRVQAWSDSAAGIDCDGSDDEGDGGMADMPYRFDAPSEERRDVALPHFRGGGAHAERLAAAHERAFRSGTAAVVAEPAGAELADEDFGPVPCFLGYVEYPGVMQGLDTTRRVVCDERGDRIVWPWELPAGHAAEQPPVGACSGGASTPSTDYAAAYFATPNPHGEGWGSHPADTTVRAGLAAATADGYGGANSSGVRAWKGYCGKYSRAYVRPVDPNAPLWVKLSEEQNMMRFIAALIDDRSIAVATARGYYGAANAWHLRETGIGFCAGMDTKRLTEMVKGLKKLKDGPPTQLRRGLSPQQLRQGMDIVYPPNTAENVNIRAMLTTAMQGLLRGREAGCKNSFDSELDIARGDIATSSGERLAFFMRPAKNMRHRRGKTVPIVIGGGGEFVDAAAEVRRMLDLDPTPEGERMTTPMFRKPDGSAFTTDDIRNIVRQIVFAIGEDPAEFGAHSLRIGGATALFAAGADPIHIRTMGRWSSDCYRLYVRACFEQTMAWTRRLGSQKVHDIQGTYERAAQETELY